MRLPDLLRTTVFRWTASLTLAFTGLSLLLFAFIYWQTAAYERGQVDAMLRRYARHIAASPDLAARGLTTWLQEDLHNRRYGVLVGRDGQPLAGNMPGLPADLPQNDVLHRVTTIGHDHDADDGREEIRALAVPLGDGRVLVLGNDTDEVDRTTAVILRALGLGLVPMLALSLAAALFLGRQATRRVAALDTAPRAIRRDGLGGRLPISPAADEFDHVAAGVNAMLDEIERLVAEIRVVGENIAHDIRTPLTRVRARLEQARETTRTPAAFQAVVDETVGWLDQTLDMVTAILRISEIEQGRRRAAFGPVPLAPVLAEAVELYAPLAETKGVALSLVSEGGSDLRVTGDPDLIFEALVNLLDNAIKFTPSEGAVELLLYQRDGKTVVAVADTGPGIAPPDRARVLQRFFRAEPSRHSPGHGLGLAFVHAVAALHDFELRIEDNQPGCRISLICPAPVFAIAPPRLRAAAPLPHLIQAPRQAD